MQQSNGVSFILNAGDSADVWKSLKQERDMLSAVSGNRPSGENISALLACTGVDRGLWSGPPLWEKSLTPARLAAPAP